MLPEPQPVGYPSERGRNYTPPEGSVLRPAGGFLLELTWLRDHKEPYNLGENEIHLAVRVKDKKEAHRLHQEMGCICFENPEMDLYFISDPDGYWIEIIG